MEDLGLVTAYSYAVSAGYTGTKEEFAELMASYATVAEEAAESAEHAAASAEAAAGSATNAAASATQAGTAATNAASSASAAGTSASQAQTAAQSAGQSKADAQTAASSASGSATSAEASKTAAAGSATAAQTAQTASETAQGKAEDAQEAAEVAQAAAEAAAEEAEQTLESYAHVDGEYDAMVVGSAKQLIADTGVTDSVPYMLRASGGEGADREEDMIVGGTVAWNQLVDANTTSVTIQSGHKYYSKIGGTASIGASTGTAISVTGGTDNVIDLTTAFGTEIADYIYQIETATAGAGVAWLKQCGFLTENYYEYSQPTLQSVTGVSAHKMVGFNQWDGTYEAGKGILVDGSVASRSGRNLSDYIRVIPNTTYYLMNVLTGRTGISYALYDADKTFIMTGGQNGSVGSEVASFELTTPSNCSYARIIIPDSALASACINLNSALNGQYEPYTVHEYPLDSTLTLRGIPKIADGKLYYDGDTYESDGTVTRRYGVVDLGTLDWVYVTTSDRNYFRVNAAIGRKANTPVICSKYTYGGNVYDSAMANAQTGIYTAISSALVQIKDTNYADVAAFKASLSGVYMVYELATASTEQATPYHNPKICDPYGTEEYVTTGIIPVGHTTFYPENLRSKIEELPKDFSTLIAPTESTFKATQNYTTGALFIVNNVLYKATANIANGATITPNTNCTATTLAAVIAALS